MRIEKDGRNGRFLPFLYIGIVYSSLHTACAISCPH